MYKPPKLEVFHCNLHKFTTPHQRFRMFSPKALFAARSWGRKPMKPLPQNWRRRPCDARHVASSRGDVTSKWAWSNGEGEKMPEMRHGNVMKYDRPNQTEFMDSVWAGKSWKKAEEWVEFLLGNLPSVRFR